MVTASTYNQVEPKIKYCLEKHFPYLSWYDVFVTFHKQMIKADVLVDDGYHNLVGGEYLKILLDKPYNQSNDDEKNDIHRVYNWYEAYDLIKKEAEKEEE